MPSAIANTFEALIWVKGSTLHIGQSLDMKTAMHSQTVVIVDDDDSTRHSLRFLFECEGIAVLDYSSGEQLLVEDWPPDVGCMILDINMPGMSGIEILEELRKARSPLPVIIVTGQPSAAHRDKALAAGAIAFLEKPVNDGRLIELVSQALAGHDKHITR